MLHGDAHFDALREGNGGKIVAGGPGHVGHHRVVVDIQAGMFDQPGIHGTVEKPVIDDVVHMPIHVVVMPARGDRLEVAVGAAQRALPGHGQNAAW
ncbi:hypothetical protein D3C79_1018260 [compost metagenome]